MKTQEWGREREESRDCLEKHGREREMERRRRNGRGMEGRESLSP